MPSPPQKSDRIGVVVAGMHRSGTSAMARLLGLAGGELPRRIMQPGPDNPLGFWEPWEMVALDDAMLAAASSRWDDPFGHRVAAHIGKIRDRFLPEARRFLAENYADSDLAVLKDPRASLVIEVWNEALTREGLRPVHVVMVRHPLEVAASIAARSGAAVEASVLAWSACMLAVERDTRGRPRVFVDYQTLLQDWRGTLDRIETVMGRPWPVRSAETDKEIEDFLSPDHRHHTEPLSDLADRKDLWAGVGKVFDWMRAAADDQAPDPARLDALTAELDRIAEIAEPALRDLRTEASAYPALKAELKEAQGEIETLRSLANQFHAEADHNGRHWEAARDQVAHIVQELELARAEALVARADARAAGAANHRIAMAEAQTLRHRAQAGEYVEALEKERRLLASLTAHGASVARELETVRSQLAEREAQIADANARAEAAASRADELARSHAAVLTSPSWKATRPFRVLLKRLRGSTSKRRDA